MNVMMFKRGAKAYIQEILRKESIRRRNKRIKRKTKARSLLKNNYKLDMDAMLQQNIGEEIKDLKPTRKRFYRCCVPYCPTYGPSDNFTSFPTSNSTRRRSWLDKIPRKNWIVCHNTLICKNHFRTNGDSKEIITDNDTPIFFPQPTLPNFEEKYGKIDKRMFQISPIYALPETFGDLALIPNSDQFIFEFSALMSKYKEQLKMVLELCKWMTEENCDQLIFYQVYSVDGCVKVSTSIVIDAELRPIIALEGIIMDPLDCTRHVPVAGRITHWNQLNLMLLDYGFDRQKEGGSFNVIRSTITI